MEAYQVCFAKTRSWPSLGEKLSIGIPITATVFLAFLANAYITAIILTRLRVMIIAGKIHYLLANVCLAQCIYLSAHFLSSLPSIFSPQPIYNEPTMLILAAPNTIGYYTVLLSNLFIAIDRFVSLFAATFYSKQATTLGIIGISLIWLLSTTISALQADAGCHKRFNQWLMVYSYGCNGANCGRPFILGLTFDDFLTYFGQGICSLMFVLYLLCFLNIAHKQRHLNASTTRNKRNLMVVIQFFCIFLFQWATSTCLILGFRLFGTSIITTVIANFAGIFNAAVNALCLLCFNRKLRSHFRASWFASQVLKTVGALTQASPNLGSKISTVSPLPPASMPTRSRPMKVLAANRG